MYYSDLGAQMCSLFLCPPTLGKLKGHIAFGLSMHASVRASVTKFIKIQYMDSSSKNNCHIFFLSLDYPPLRSYARFKGS